MLAATPAPGPADDGSLETGARRVVAPLLRSVPGFSVSVWTGGGDLLSEAQRAVLFEPMRTSLGEDTGYACGWGIGEDASGRTYAVHRGGAIGGRGVLLLYPDHGVGVAITGNLDGPNLVEEAVALAALFLGPA